MSPVRAPADRTRWTVGLVVAGAAVVIAIGFLGPRPPSAHQARAPTADATDGRAAVTGLSASQAGYDVTVQGAVADHAGPLVVALQVGATVLAADEVEPEGGRFVVTLRPRVPPGGLIAAYIVRPARSDVGTPVAEGSVVLEATTAFRRSVDPLTGRTRLTGPTP